VAVVVSAAVVPVVVIRSESQTNRSTAGSQAMTTHYPVDPPPGMRDAIERQQGRTVVEIDVGDPPPPPWWIWPAPFLLAAWCLPGVRGALACVAPQQSQDPRQSRAPAG